MLLLFLNRELFLLYLILFLYFEFLFLLFYNFHYNNLVLVYHNMLLIIWIVLLWKYIILLFQIHHVNNLNTNMDLSWYLVLLLYLMLWKLHVLLGHPLKGISYKLFLNYHLLLLFLYHYHIHILLHHHHPNIRVFHFILHHIDKILVHIIYFYHILCYLV